MKRLLAISVLGICAVAIFAFWPRKSPMHATAPADPIPAVQPVTSLAASSPVAPPETAVTWPAQSGAIPGDDIAWARNPYVTYEVTSALRRAGINLTSEQVQQLAILCYKTEKEMLVQFAAYGKVTAPEANVRLVDVVVPAEVAKTMRDQFLAQIRPALGTDLSWDDPLLMPAVDGLAKRLRYFGERPWTFSFEGENDTLAKADNVEWRESYSGKPNEALIETIFGGVLPRPSFQILYGPLADRVIFDR